MTFSISRQAIIHPNTVDTTIIIELKLSETISPRNVDELDRNTG
jgi:hypothetical protein